MSKSPEERGINFIKSMCSNILMKDNEFTRQEFDFYRVKGYVFTLKEKFLLRLKEPDTELYIERIFKNSDKSARVIINAANRLIERSMGFTAIETLSPTLVEQPANLAEAIFISICKIIKNKNKNELEKITRVKLVINEVEAFLIEKEKSHILQDLKQV